MIEALLQQDIDLGLTRHDFDPVRSPLEEVEPVPEKSARLDDEVGEQHVDCAGDAAVRGGWGSCRVMLPSTTDLTF